MLDRPHRLSRSKSAEKMRRSRARAKERAVLAEALIEVGKLSEWDEKNVAAIDLALWKLGQDFADFVTGNGVDPIAFAKLIRQTTIASE